MHERYLENFSYTTPDGQEYWFKDYWRCLLSFTGTGMPSFDYHAQQGPYQHGETFFDYRAQKRIMQLVHRVDGCSRCDYWQHRHELLDILRPNRQYQGQFVPGTFTAYEPCNVTRAIKCFIEEGPAFAPRTLEYWDEWGFTETLRFVCPDPIWYDPTLVCIVLYGATSLNELVFPVNFKNPVFHPAGTELIFESLVVAEQTQFVYAGNWQSFPETITIWGPLHQPVITNLTTGEHIGLAYNVAAGERVTIYLAYGNKYVLNSAGLNLTPTVTPDSDFVTFHIEPYPGAPGQGVALPAGTNTFLVTGTDQIAGVTRVEMTYYTRYVGI